MRVTFHRVLIFGLFLGLIGVLFTLFFADFSELKTRDKQKIQLISEPTVPSVIPASESLTGVEVGAFVDPPQTRREWAKKLEQGGIQVGWDEKVGNPFSLRGKGLGVRPLDGRPGRSVFKGTYGDRALAVMENLAAVYGIRNVAMELKPSGPEDLDDLGFRHQRLGQQYEGIPVVGGDLKVHFDAEGIPYEVSGRFVSGIQVNIQPTISTSQSEETARQAFVVHVDRSDNCRIYAPARLVVLATTPSPILAFEVGVSSTLDQVYKFWVDAHSGEVIRQVSQVCGIQAPSIRGTSVPLRGMKLPNEGGAYTTFPGWRENGVYYMYDPGSYTYVFNCNNNSVIANDVSNNTNDFGTFAYRRTVNWGNSDPGAVSVAANMVTILSYYKNIHNRRSADGLGTLVPAYVHYGPDVANAFWSPQLKAMIYGDGDEDFFPMAVLDVAGHELTHGVINFTADLEYQNESGALNESFADIFGTTVEFYGQPDMSSRYPERVLGAADWLMGEDCVRNGPPIRDMRSPTNTNTAMSPQPSRYGGKNWVDYNQTSFDNGGVHINSGVQNHFYYLLCQGGRGTNDGIVYNLSGIGMNNARHIAYRALVVYCNKHTTFAGARSAWLSAAKDLNSSWVTPVAAAWSAVGVSGSGVGAGSGGPTGGLPTSFSSAENISGRFFNATVGGSRVSSGQTYWWKWTAPSTGRLRLDTSRSTSGADTILQVYAFSNTVTTNRSTQAVTTNSVLPSPARFTNDNQSSFVRWSQLDFGVTQGENLAFAVSGMKAGENLVLSGVLAAQNGPPHDAFSSAVVKTGTRWTDRGSTMNGSAETGEPAHAGSAAASSVWFSWTAPDNRTVTVSTAGSTGDTLLAVYNGDEVNSLTRVASSDDLTRTDKTSQVRFGANAGTTYRIAVDSKNGQAGPYVLELR